MSKSHDQLTILPMNEALISGDDGRSTSKVLRTIEGHHVELSRQLNQYYARRKSWLARLFPNELDRVLLDLQLNQAKTECALNERVLAIACAMKLDACREAAEVWVKSMTVETRETFFRFVAARTAVLQEIIEQKRVEFAEHMARRYATAERYRAMPEFYERYRQSIEDEIQATMTWLDDLLIEFRSIVQKRVAHYDRPEITHN